MLKKTKGNDIVLKNFDRYIPMLEYIGINSILTLELIFDKC